MNANILLPHCMNGIATVHVSKLCFLNSHIFRRPLTYRIADLRLV